MALTKSKGNMYPWVTHTHSHLGGECPHKCAYCYVKSFPFAPEKFRGPLRLIEKELAVPYRTGKTIFIEHCNDLFAEDVHLDMILPILEHCRKWPENTYVFQTKNPCRYLRRFYGFPENKMIGCTIETNRDIPLSISRAPSPKDRIHSFAHGPGRKFVTIEPIMDFDVDILASWIDQIRPEFVNIGADSKGHRLPEPPPEKVNELIWKLTGYGIEIREKHNLGRLMR